MTEERARAVRSLATALRGGLTFRRALADGRVIEAGGVARRIRLGLPMGEALEGARSFFGVDVDTLRFVAELHGRTGGDPAAMLDAVAGSIEGRIAGAGRAEAGAAGARLSARVVAWLPLAALLLLPGGRAPLLDPPGIAVFAAGAALCFAGMRWMDRLLPRSEPEIDRAVLLAVVAASALRSGCTLNQVLDAAARGHPDGNLRSAGRRHRLGVPWPEALVASPDDGLRALGEALRIPERTGVPAASALERFAERRAAALERDMECEIRRAPVKMVIPLTVCILPSFGLIALTPFLRSLVPA